MPNDKGQDKPMTNSISFQYFSRRSTLAGLASVGIFSRSSLAAEAGKVGVTPGAVWHDNRGIAINAHGGGVLRHKGMYYWFGEHKIAGEMGNTAQVGVHVYRSRDLIAWEDAGIALSVSEDPTSDIVRGSIIERPKVIYNENTGKFVMWFHLELKGQAYLAARCGVAVADRAEGPYRFLRSIRPNAGIWPINVMATDKLPSKNNFLARDFAVGQMSRDMTLHVDTDRKAYLIAASEENKTLHVSLLSDDFQKLSGYWTRILPGGENEAPAIFKHGGRYYMFTSGLTGWAPNPARSYVADSLFGPWRSLGNPIRGQVADISTTFGAQSTFVIPHGKGFIFMADRWNPKNPIDGRYVWLPVEWEGEKPVLKWRNHWSLHDLDA